MVDDGSQDNSRDVITARPKVVAIFKQNGGHPKALKNGVEAAKGDVIISLDADDWLLDHACGRIAEV